MLRQDHEIRVARQGLQSLRQQGAVALRVLPGKVGLDQCKAQRFLHQRLRSVPQGISMMCDVVSDEAGDEEIAVVITCMQTQRQRMLGSKAGCLQQFRFQLLDQEGVGLALIHTDGQLILRLSTERNTVLLLPTALVAAQITAQRLVAPGTVHRRADWRKR